MLVAIQFLGALAYITHYHPQTAVPLTVVLCGATLLAACVVPIAVR
ncbi:MULTISPECIES: hypothetical protein [unclassified Streptomyces]